MTDIEKAKSILAGGGLTCVLCRGGEVYTSDQSGIAPMLGFLDRGTDLTGFSAADKIIGRAAAMLFVLAGVAEVYGEVMSRAALPVFEAHRLRCSYGTLTDRIINRAGNGICPMEETVAQIDVPAAALPALKEKLRILRGGAQKNAAAELKIPHDS